MPFKVTVFEPEPRVTAGRVRMSEAAATSMLLPLRISAGVLPVPLLVSTTPEAPLVLTAAVKATLLPAAATFWIVSVRR